MQDVLTDWDGTGRGYTCDVQGGNDALLTFIVIATTPIVFILILALLGTLETVLKKKHRFKDLEFAVLYAGFEIPAFAVIVFEFWSSCVLVAECKNFSCILKASTVVVIFTYGYLFTVFSTYQEYKNEKFTLIRHNFFFATPTLFKYGISEGTRCPYIH